MIDRTITTAELEPGDIVAGHGTVKSVTSIRPVDKPTGMRGVRRVEFVDAPPVPLAAIDRTWDLERPPPTYYYPVRDRVEVDRLPGEPGEPCVYVITDGRRFGFAFEHHGPNHDAERDGDALVVVVVGDDGRGVELRGALYPAFAGERFARHFGLTDPQIRLPAIRPR